MYSDATSRIRQLLSSNGYAFKENSKLELFSFSGFEFPRVVNSEIRPLNCDHVNLLLARMKKNSSNILKLMHQTPIIVSSVDANTQIIDGSHRLDALFQLNRSQPDPNLLLWDFCIPFTILSKVPLEHQLILTSLAESETFENKYPLTKYEIMRHTRLLLIKCPQVLGLEPIPKNSTTKQQSEYAKKCVKAVGEFFHVGHPLLIISNIWKVTRISDEDFEKMYLRFSQLPSGFVVNDFDIVFNKYPSCPKRITELMTMEEFPPLKEFRKMFRNNLKKELIPLMQQHGIFNPSWSATQYVDTMKHIIGKEYYNLNGAEKSEETLIKYILDKKRNLRKTNRKIEYLYSHFSEWLQAKNQLRHQSQPNASNNATAVNQRITDISELQNASIMQLINHLAQNNRESIAACMVHFILRPNHPFDKLPQFYRKYLYSDSNDFDLTKLPTDNGTPFNFSEREKLQLSYAEKIGNFSGINKSRLHRAKSVRKSGPLIRKVATKDQLEKRRIFLQNNHTVTQQTSNAAKRARSATDFETSPSSTEICNPGIPFQHSTNMHTFLHNMTEIF